MCRQADIQHLSISFELPTHGMPPSPVRPGLTKSFSFLDPTRLLTDDAAHSILPHKPKCTSVLFKRWPEVQEILGALTFWRRNDDTYHNQNCSKQSKIFIEKKMIIHSSTRKRCIKEGYCQSRPSQFEVMDKYILLQHFKLRIWAKKTRLRRV